MDAHEIQEQSEHAHHAGEKGIGLTMAVVAVMLAIATLLSHRSHTEEVLLQGEIVDQWSFYQSKHTRAHTYGELAEIEALLPNGQAAALKNLKVSVVEECGVPAEEKCASPVIKDSPVLQQLLASMKSGEAGSEAEHATRTEHPPAATEHAAKAKPAEKDQKEAQTAAPAKDAHPVKGKEDGHEASEHKKEKPVKEGAVHIQEKAKEMEKDRDVIQHRANYYDGSELFLEISIVLCSIALLSENKLFWKLSFVSTIAGVAVAVMGHLGLWWPW